jgi:hypothetical protein
MVYGEINKNIFTLFQVQKRLLRSRRNDLQNFTKDTWKKYFEQNVEKLEEKDKPSKKVRPKMVKKGVAEAQVDKPKKKKKSHFT